MAPVAESANTTTTQNVDSLAKNPLERTWRGNKEGTVKLQFVPDFGGDKYAERQWVKVRIFPHQSEFFSVRLVSVDGLPSLIAHLWSCVSFRNISQVLFAFGANLAMAKV